MTTGRLLGSTDLIGAATSAGYARCWVRELLGGDHPALDHVMLLVSETVTNSVVHSDSRNGGRISLVLAESEAAVRVNVIDAGAPTEPRVCRDEFGEGGRGMFLVDRIAERWGIDEVNGCRVVWFEVATDGCGAGDASASGP